MAQRRHHRPRPTESELESGELANEVRLDKPFMFLIADIQTKLVLYTHAHTHTSLSRSSERSRKRIASNELLVAQSVTWIDSAPIIGYL
jgi:hypothetical protein